jgi:hypothetical protein
MNITLQLEEFYDLLVGYTVPPNTAMFQSKLRPIIKAIEVELKARAELEIKLKQSESERADLVAQVNVLNAKKATELVPYMGVFWKRFMGGFEPNPYCPKCKGPLAGNPPPRPLLWICVPCGVHVNAPTAWMIF